MHRRLLRLRHRCPASAAHTTTATTTTTIITTIHLSHNINSICTNNTLSKSSNRGFSSTATASVLRNQQQPKNTEEEQPQQQKTESSENEQKEKEEKKNADENDSTTTTDKATTEEGEQKSKGGKDDDSKPLSPSKMIAMAVAFGLAIYFIRSAVESAVKSQKEITFKELVDKYVRTGMIDHLEYDMTTNEVYVYLKKNHDGSSIADQQHHDLHTAEGGESHRQTTSSSSSSSGGHYDYVLRAMSVENFEQHMQDMEEKLGIPASNSINIAYRDEFNTSSVVISLIETMVILGLLFYMQRRSGRMMDAFNVNKVSVRTDHNTKVAFKDVAGMDEAKLEIVEFVDFLKNPQRFRRLGAKIPRGAILMGPPGTGKTLLAKAVAGESGVPFFSMSGSDFVEMFVGVGPARVRDLFKQARQHERSIVYIDEIDAIARPRGQGSSFGGGNDERENTLNQLLVELDGFNENSGIIVLASTNVDRDGLDPALMRPGRFDRQITVDKPDQHERVEIFKVHLKPLKVSQEIMDRLDRIAELTPGMTGADIANVCNEGAIYAARKSRDEVTLADLEQAIERVVGGIEKKNTPITPEERKVIAYHEAGHAVVAWFCKFCDPLLKLSIIPRGRALGYAQYVPKESYIRTYEQMQDMLAQALGGRVAEQMVFGHLSTGARDDLQKITRIAYAAVSTFGMNTNVGPVSFPPPGDQSMSVQKPYGEETAWTIDEEARKLINSAYDRCREILKDKEELLQSVAQYLIKNEKMTIDEFKELAGPRPYATDEKGIMPADVIDMSLFDYPSQKNAVKRE